MTVTSIPIVISEKKTKSKFNVFALKNCRNAGFAHLKSKSTVHLLGVGDFPIESVTRIDDPCRMPRKSGDTTRIRKKEDTLYAPQANVGLINMGTDGVYVDLKDVRYTKDDALSIAQSDGQSHKEECTNHQRAK